MITNIMAKPLILRISPSVNSEDGINFAMLFTLKTTRIAGELHFSRQDNAKRLVQGLRQEITVSPGL